MRLTSYVKPPLGNCSKQSPSKQIDNATAVASARHLTCYIKLFFRNKLIFFQYYCDESAVTAYIDRVDEPSTCSYVITVKTHLICSHPHTRLLSRYQAMNMVCQPLLPDAMYNRYQEQKKSMALVSFISLRVV